MPEKGTGMGAYAPLDHPGAGGVRSARRAKGTLLSLSARERDNDAHLALFLRTEGTQAPEGTHERCWLTLVGCAGNEGHVDVLKRRG